MEGHCSTGQSPQWALVPMEEEEDDDDDEEEEAKQHTIAISVRTTEPGYNDIGLCDISSVISDTEWYQLIRYCQP